MDLELDGISLIAVVVGTVEFAKSMGVPSKWCLAGALVVGVAAVIGMEAATQFPVVAPWLLAVVKGLVIGMSATGLYKAARRFQEKPF